MAIFIKKLCDQGINAIVDIRENPFSRKPGFSKNPLEKHLKQAGINYYHFQELGTPKPLRKFLTDYNDYETFFSRYKAFLPEFQDSLDDIIDMGSKKNICLLCFEKDPHFCHRKIVADYIKESAGTEIKVVHL